MQNIQAGAEEKDTEDREEPDILHGPFLSMQPAYGSVRRGIVQLTNYQNTHSTVATMSRQKERGQAYEKEAFMELEAEQCCEIRYGHGSMPQPPGRSRACTGI